MSKQKSKKGRSRVRIENDSDNESINENVSVYSNGSYDIENIESQDDLQIASPTEKYEEKIIQLIENATEKSAKTRIQAIQGICEILRHRHFPDFIDGRKLTIIDIIEKSLRRGKEKEQEEATRLALLLIIQIGEADDDFKSFGQYFSTSLHNPACSYSIKTRSSMALAMFHFLTSDDINSIVGVMQQFEQVFAGSYPKADKSSATVSDELAQLHVGALRGWGLLATLIPPSDFCTHINDSHVLPSINNLIGLLNSPHVEIRMACGEIIAVTLERGRIFDEIFLSDCVPKLIELTCVLSKDSQKHHCKKERRAQRSSFRDVFRYLDQDVSPAIQVRFGTEVLDLNTWSANIQYENLCDVIGPCITTHLTENEFVREILQLGSKIVQSNNGSVYKQTKLERHLMNAAAFKARTLSMKKSRDKRSAVFH